MADPNNLVLHEYRLGLMFVCKAGNTSIKRAIGEAIGIHEESPHRIDRHYPSINKADMLMYREQGYQVLSVIRHPLARLASCWADKVCHPHRFHRPFGRKYSGIRPGMSFAEFVRFVAKTPDGIADQHIRSMTWDLLSHDGELIPEVIRIESPDWWSTLHARIVNHCGLDIGPQRAENRTGVQWRELYDTETESLARERYANDLSRFYP